MAAGGIGVFTSTPTEASDPDPVDRGRLLYEEYCITCHGATGGGIVEARLAFPETHRNCERCHRPSHPSTSLDPSQIFSIGNPPALRALGPNGRFPSADSVLAFIRTRMPRHSPGSLAESEYEALVAYLLGGLTRQLEDVQEAPEEVTGNPSHGRSCQPLP